MLYICYSVIVQKMRKEHKIEQQIIRGACSPSRTGWAHPAGDRSRNAYVLGFGQYGSYGVAQGGAGGIRGEPDH